MTRSLQKSPLKNERKRKEFCSSVTDKRKQMEFCSSVTGERGRKEFCTGERKRKECCSSVKSKEKGAQQRSWWVSTMEEKLQDDDGMDVIVSAHHLLSNNLLPFNGLKD